MKPWEARSRASAMPVWAEGPPSSAPGGGHSCPAPDPAVPAANSSSHGPAAAAAVMSVRRPAVAPVTSSGAGPPCCVCGCRLPADCWDLQLTVTDTAHTPLAEVARQLRLCGPAAVAAAGGRQLVCGCCAGLLNSYHRHQTVAARQLGALMLRIATAGRGSAETGRQRGLAPGQGTGEVRSDRPEGRPSSPGAAEETRPTPDRQGGLTGGRRAALMERRGELERPRQHGSVTVRRPDRADGDDADPESDGTERRPDVNEPVPGNRDTDGIDVTVGVNGASNEKVDTPESQNSRQKCDSFQSEAVNGATQPDGDCLASRDLTPGVIPEHCVSFIDSSDKTGSQLCAHSSVSNQSTKCSLSLAEVDETDNRTNMRMTQGKLTKFDTATCFPSPSKVIPTPMKTGLLRKTEGEIVQLASVESVGSSRALSVARAAEPDSPSLAEPDSRPPENAEPGDEPHPSRTASREDMESVQGARPSKSPPSSDGERSACSSRSALALADAIKATRGKENCSVSQLFHGSAVECQSAPCAVQSASGVGSPVVAFRSSVAGLRCSCGKRFSKASQLASHSRIHSGEKPYRCPQCDKSFRLSKYLTSHIRTHTNERPYACAQCGRAFKEPQTLHVHERLHSGERPFRCVVCTRSFTQSGHLKAHQRSHHAVTATARCLPGDYVCTTCGASFTRVASLHRHAMTHGGRAFQCERCGKPFAFASELRTHTRIVHDGERRFMCELCGRAFSQGGHLKTHLLTHSGERPHACRVCARRFARRDALTVHERRHTGARPFRCARCGRSYAHRSGLRGHARFCSAVAIGAGRAAREARGKKANDSS